jgi:hypothetical protein
MTWVLLRKALNKDSKWEFCGFTPHDEFATEFEELNQEEYTVALFSLED